MWLFLHLHSLRLLNLKESKATDGEILGMERVDFMNFDDEYHYASNAVEEGRTV